MNQETFDLLYKQLKSDTKHLSNTSRILLHPCFIRLMDEGESIAPMVFQAMQKNKDHVWIMFLWRMFRVDNVIKPEHRGKLTEMTEDWLEWGKEKGLVKPLCHSVELLPVKKQAFWKDWFGL